MDEERKIRTNLYIRICKDSGYTIPYDQAAQLAAKIVGWHPLSFMGDIGLDNMKKIATGRHPACMGLN